MKKPLAILALVLVVAGLFFLSRTKNSPAPQSPGANEIASSTTSNLSTVQNKIQTGSATVENAPAHIATVQTDLASRAASPSPTATISADTNELPALPPLTILDKTRVMIHNYHAAFGENPVGINPEIAAALQGKNPKQINFLADSGLRLNGKGEIIDGYGTPFFFHQISAHEMEIHSAGPDKLMWTPDDVVTR